MGTTIVRHNERQKVRTSMATSPTELWARSRDCARDSLRVEEGPEVKTNDREIVFGNIKAPSPPNLWNKTNI